MQLNGHCGSCAMAGEIEIAGETLTECPVSLAARESDAVFLASLVSPVSSCGMLSGYRDGELPPRLRSLRRHAQAWSEIARPRKAEET